MYNYDDLIFENQNAKLLCMLLHEVNPLMGFPRLYVSEEFAVSFYNFFDKHINIASDEYIPDSKPVCYIPLYSKPIVKE